MLIKDTIKYRNQDILTIYHRGFAQAEAGRRVERKEKSGKYNLIFREESVEESEIMQLSGWSWKEEGVLPAHEKINPYSDRASARMEHYVFFKKPDTIFKEKNDLYQNKLSIQQLTEVISFIQRYTGVDLTDRPIYMGDVFVFSCTKCDYHLDDNRDIILESVSAGMTIIIHCKKSERIVFSQILEIQKDEENFTIHVNVEWNSMELQIFREGKLCFYENNIAFASQIHLRFSVDSGKQRIPLKKLRDYFEIPNQKSAHETIVGEERDKAQDVLLGSNAYFVKKINNEKASSRFWCISPGEEDIAVDVITKVMMQAADDVWLFDAYLTERNYIGNIMDWMRILANCHAKKKHLFFYCKDSTLTLEEFEHELCSDKEVAKGKPDIFLYQTRTSIHDRFLIIRSGEEFGGLTIGTSLNSLASNHYCINKLTHAEAQSVYQSIMRWLKDSNIVQRGEVTYEE